VTVVTVVAVVAALVVGWALGTRSGGETQTTTAYCSIVADFVSCGESPGSSEYVGGTFVQWVDEGTIREGRPACVRGDDQLVRVTIYFEEVDVQGRRIKQIVGVDCDTAVSG
jgi:hypothetical protein